ncbi:MAG: arsenate reductase ArsC [Dehalococcoidia bacterium]|nr:arsenate reductase ArsC [Dehalococcoidia bacterium]
MLERIDAKAGAQMTTDQRPLQVLFLGSRNVARSQMAECLLNSIGSGRYKAHSAGILPASEVHPLAIELLKKNKLPTDRLQCKDWQRFAPPGLLDLDVVVSVCESPVAEINSKWLGNPLLTHWQHTDPVALDDEDGSMRRAFFHTYNQLVRRLTIFASLPLTKLDRDALKRRIDDIGLKGA